MARWARLAAAAVTVGAAVAAAPTLLRAVWSWPHRVAVEGHSMEPGLRAGDWLLVDPEAFLDRPPRAGDLIVVRDSRVPARVLVKRVGDVLPDGRLVLAGDHPAHAANGERVPPIQPADVVGRPWLRYWPPVRAGIVR